MAPHRRLPPVRSSFPIGSPKGISYIEILLATVILTIGILGVAGAVTTAALNIHGGGQETAATEMAQAMLERIRNAGSFEDLLSYADTPPGGATSPRPAYVTQNRNAWLAALQSQASGGVALGQGRITITSQGVIPNRLALVTVSVDWATRTGPNPLTSVTRVTEWP
jgi:Tfp pilus assembly protein PilV